MVAMLEPVARLECCRYCPRTDLRAGREKLRGIRSAHKKPFLSALRRCEATKGPITPGYSLKRDLAPNADILARDPHLIIE